MAPDPEATLLLLAVAATLAKALDTCEHAEAAVLAARETVTRIGGRRRQWQADASQSKSI